MRPGEKGQTCGVTDQIGAGAGARIEFSLMSPYPQYINTVQSAWATMGVFTEFRPRSMMT